MRLLFDTNVLVSAYATHGACYELLNHCFARHTLCISEFILDELQEKLLQKIKLTPEETARIIHFLRRNAECVPEAKLERHFAKDHDDDHILAAALSGRVDCILTGDKELLVLKRFFEIPIFRPADFWKFEESFKTIP
jgi:uncharacterized protein